MQSLQPRTYHKRPRLTPSNESGQRWIRIEDAGSGKEIAERVRRGKASLKIVQTPWGIEFHICNLVDDANGVRILDKILVPPTQVLSADMNAGNGTRGIRGDIPPAVGVLGLGGGKSVFAALTLLCLASNLIAFVVSSSLPPMYVELNRLVQPGSLLSLARTEGFILMCSFVLLAIVRSVSERMILQGLILGVLAADAVNDIALLSTGNWLLAIELAVATAVLIPSLVGILTTRKLGSLSTGST